VVADFLDISRSSIYDWLRQYRARGEAALDTRKGRWCINTLWTILHC